MREAPGESIYMYPILRKVEESGGEILTGQKGKRKRKTEVVTPENVSLALHYNVTDSELIG